MTPPDLAFLYRAAFPQSRPWTEQEFSDLLASPWVQLFGDQDGFALIRRIDTEAELLTIAIHPDRQRQGQGRALMLHWHAALASAGANAAFLEVAADNLPALGLYRSLGYAETGRRKRYYTRLQGPAVDAILMARSLP